MVELMNGAFSSITINDLLVVLPQGIGLSAFSLPAQPCQILVSVTCHLLPHCLKPSVSNKDGVSDDWDTLGLGKSVNYSALSKSLLKRLNEATIEHDERVQSLEDLVEVIVSHCAAESPSSLERIDVKVERRRALLFSESVSVHTSVIVEYPQALEEETFPDYVGLRTSNRTFKINGIQADTIIGLNPHERLEKQRLEMDLEVDLGKLFGLGGNSSELAFDYKSLGQTALQYLNSTSFKTLESLAHNILLHLLSRIPISTGTHLDRKTEYSTLDDVSLEIQIRKPAAIAFARCPSIEMRRCWRDYKDASDGSTEEGNRGIPEPIAQALIPPMRDGIASSSGSSECEEGCDHPQKSSHKAPSSTSTTSVIAYIAIGTNLGDRIANIKAATEQLSKVDEIQADRKQAEQGLSEVTEGGYVKVRRCSRLYESQPMYELDQGEFINGVIEVETNLSPLALLLHLKRIENHLGRVKTKVNGPRLIDLDLTMYGSEVVKIGEKGDREGQWGVPGAGWLEVPHWGIGEREFVLRPLVDLNPDLMHPSYGKSMASLLQLLRSQEANPEQTPALVPIIPFGVPSRPARCDPYRPLIMGILNVTPDSFSDGETERVRRTAEAEEEEDLDGKTWLEHVLGLARQLIANGADILDIGGMSTRPGVSDDSVTFEEELSRVVPIIQAIRVEGIDIPISVDTFRPEVAEAAVAAGANCINDVRGGREAGMLETMSRLDVPVVLMHSRGNSISMTSDQAKDYTTAGGVLNGVKTELSETIRRAEEAGIKRWNTILDPGIGFAKTLKGNLELLRSLEELFGDPLTTINPTSNEAVLSNYNVLVGASRKGFIGTITSRPSPQDREYGNAAIIARCTDSGIVSIVRVHEPGPSKDVIMMTEAIKMG